MEYVADALTVWRCEGYMHKGACSSCRLLSAPWPSFNYFFLPSCSLWAFVQLMLGTLAHARFW